MTELEKAADEYANSIAQHDHNKVFSIDDFKAGAQWQKKQLIEKACKWLEDNKDNPFIGCEDPCLSGYLTDQFIADFRNYMKGE